MGRITASEVLSASPDDAYAIVVDVGDFPRFMHNIVSCDIVEENADRKLVEWVMEVDGAELEWTEEILYDHPALTARFHSVSGIFERFDGVWQVEAEAPGARVRLELEFELGLPEIEDIIGGILHDKLGENVAAMLRAIRDRAA